MFNKTLLYVVHIFLIWNILTKDAKSFRLYQGNLPDQLSFSRVLDFVKPIIKSFPSVQPVFRTFEGTEVDLVIRDKIAKLHPYLQDDVKNLEQNLFLDDKDETTILEFLPKTEHKNIADDKFKTNIKKYKKIREKINRALVKESVSDKTKKLVVKTLDGLMKALVGSQCKWKRNLRAEGYEEPAQIADRWNQGLHDVKNILSSILKNETRRNDDVPKFLDNLQVLFKSISKDIDIISKKYTIQCEFVPKNRLYTTNHNALRNTWDKTDDEDKCQHVIICSNELKEFLRNFYISLNDTAVSVLTNYAEMYIRDVIPDDVNERNTVISLLRNLSVKTEGNVRDVFKEHTENLQLDDEKKVNANINILINYVKNTIDDVKDITKGMIKAELVVLRQKLQKAVSEDLKVNIDVDLGNLERDFLAKMCNIFGLCNGKYTSRRSLPEHRNKNDLFVQVQLTLDDNITDINNLEQIINDTAKSRIKEINKPINVTRTTHIYNNVTVIN